MRYFKNLHPICIFSYLVVVIALILMCFDPIILLLACFGALCFLGKTESVHAALKRLKLLLPMTLIIVVANSLVSHRGVTRLRLVFGQWITLEAVCYGITSGMSLAALILWFVCYQKLMTSDKFLYLFGKAAPATALLITMALNLVTKLQVQLKQIQDSHEMLHQETSTNVQKLKKALGHVTTLLGWSLENTVEQANSMKARGYGIRKRTTFHLFHFETRDALFLLMIMIPGVFCLIGRSLGYGTMEFYPRMDPLVFDGKHLIFYGIFLLLVCIPGILEWKEELLWRSYSFNQ